jgi:hypothetical protein
LGQESLIRIYNDLGFQINNGQVLHITGSTSGVPTVALANASKIGTTFIQGLSQTSGVATHDIPNGEYGFITNFGLVRDLNTTAFTAGQEVFLSDTVDGGLTNDPNNIALTSRISVVGYCVESNATTGKILVSITNENLALSLTQLEINVLLGNTISTGVYSYTGATTASTTTINVAPMRGWMVYNTGPINSTKPSVLNIYYSGGTGISLPNLSTSDATYFLVNSGATLFQQTTFPTPQQRRENIFLGKVVHPNRLTIQAVNNTVDYDVSSMSALRDLWTPIKMINDGILVSPNGNNLNINTSSGILWGNGVGWTTNELDPNSVVISSKVAASFFYRTQTGGTSSAVSVIDPTKYDVGGVITSMGGAGSDNASNQRVYLYPTGVINILYGQTNYNNLTAAVSGIQSETFVVYPNAKTTGVLIGIISVRNDIVADGEPLTNTDYAIFTPVSKFGELLGGTGGLSTTTLQQAYNNSVSPEITTNSTLGAVSIKNGAGTADNITSLIEFLNSGGTVTSFIRADGYFSGLTFQTNGFIANSDGVTATTISATTISGGTYYGNGTNLTGVVKGSGTTNYLPKWTGTTGLGDSQIQDNAQGVGIGIAPTSGIRINVAMTSGDTYGIQIKGNFGTNIAGAFYGETTSSSGVGVYGNSIGGGIGVKGISSSGYGVYGESFGGGTAYPFGVYGVAGGVGLGSTLPNGGRFIVNSDYGGIGVYGVASEGNDGSAGEFIGGKFVSNVGSFGTTNYSVQLQDSTEGLNKVLVSVTADGKANWVDPSTIQTAFNYGLANAIMTGNFLT